MSTDSISFYGFSNPIRKKLSGTSDDLTDETRAELDSLNIDTADISTETQGQQVLKETKSQNKPEQSAKKPSARNEVRSEDSIKNDVRYLADQLGIPVSGTDATDAVINKISDTLNLLKISPGNNKALTAQIIQVQTQLEGLSNEYEQMSREKTKLTNSMDALARYNKMSLKAV